MHGVGRKEENLAACSVEVGGGGGGGGGRWIVAVTSANPQFYSCIDLSNSLHGVDTSGSLRMLFINCMELMGSNDS